MLINAQLLELFGIRQQFAEMENLQADLKGSSSDTRFQRFRDRTMTQPSTVAVVSPHLCGDLKPLDVNLHISVQKF